MHCTVLPPGFLHILGFLGFFFKMQHKQLRQTPNKCGCQCRDRGGALHSRTVDGDVQSNTDNDPNAKKNKQTRRRRKQPFALPCVSLAGIRQHPPVTDSLYEQNLYPDESAAVKTVGNSVDVVIQKRTLCRPIGDG